MSLNDGKVANEYSYITSDIALASYLMTRGFELLGAVDSGKMGNNGKARLEFGLVYPNEVEDIDQLVRRLADEFDNLFLPIPHEEDQRVNFRVYWRNIKNCHHALDEARNK